MKIVSICGSPRKGNSETILLKLQELLRQKGVENEIILLRTKNIKRCTACVEYCNHQHKCHIKDDMEDILNTYVSGDGYIFAFPNYFQMPPGIMKDFIDRSCVLSPQNREEHFKNKKAVVITVGTDSKELIKNAADTIAKYYFGEVGLTKVLVKCFRTISELKGNFNNIFEDDKNPDIQKDLTECVNFLTAN